ncbi:MAG TPA: flagellar biosynthesis protein FlhA [Polyangiales bacterium]|nr:flagellar biosynthesis protein FlhA [Polyangiales bacterium]
MKLRVFGVPLTAESTVPLILVGIVLLMVVPLPAPILDLMLATSIALSVALLLISINIEKPLDLSTFPSILLFGTLFRLALNVASTRLILLNGAEGSQAAGHVIEAFGELIIRGNYLVGATIFILLVIINFVVITKGAGRVAEVSARFTLDALPGKQMSIDADLGAGAITQDQARARRKEVEQESDFFGAMDGASKFVRGDAIAGLLMTGINIAVGFLVGVVQKDLTVAKAAQTYTILTVGDGLVTQIPALLMSTAAGVVVTRASAGAALAPALIAQLGTRKPALFGTAALLGMVAILPGMPAIPFLILATAAGLAGRYSATQEPGVARGGAQPGAATPATPSAQPSERERLEEVLPVELLELEVGFDLVPLVDASQAGGLVERVSAIRRNLASELGLILPSVHIRDNLRLAPNAYRMLVSGNEVGRGELRVGRFLAMDPTGALPPIDGEKVQEPAFGLPAQWISAAERERAETLGYTVVDAVTVAATHLTEMLRAAAPDLLGRREAQELFEIFARRETKLVDEVVPNVLPLGDVLQVLRQLLRESVPIRDLRTIFETLADAGRETKHPLELTERVRHRLARAISARFKDDRGRIAAVVLDPRAEEVFRNHGPDASSAQRVLSSLDSAARAFSGVTTPPVLLCAPDVRRAVADFLSRRIPGLSVLSYREVDPKATVRTLGVVSA